MRVRCVYIKLREREGMTMTRDEFEFMENAKKDEKSQAERWRDAQREVVKRAGGIRPEVGGGGMIQKYR